MDLSTIDSTFITFTTNTQFSITEFLCIFVLTGMFLIIAIFLVIWLTKLSVISANRAVEENQQIPDASCRMSHPICPPRKRY